MNWSTVFSILIGLLGIDILIIVHEFGHFVLSYIFHVYVEKVQIGFGPSFFTKIGKKGTQFCIGIVPYGAFCRMDTLSLQQKHPTIRILIYLAGPLANILFAVVCYTVYLRILDTNISEALRLSVLQCLNELKMFFFAIGDMAIGKVKIGDTLSGFLKASINIGSITKAGFISGFMTGVETALWLSGSVSTSLAFANLIPIPALDGGFILINIVELITHHEFSEKFQIITQCIGLALLVFVFPIARKFF